MIAVIFEVLPAEGHQQAYLDTAAALRPLLEQVDGFVSVERFQSLSTPGKLLSLSFWRDEEAVARWRQLEAHRQAQTLGRTAVFQDYRLRVAAVVRDYGMTEREQAPVDSRRRHGLPQDAADPAAGADREPGGAGAAADPDGQPSGLAGAAHPDGTRHAQ